MEASRGVVRYARALALLLACCTPVAALAVTITVNSMLDVVANDGVCTLREAIIAANTDTASGAAAGECVAGSGTDAIAFAIPGSGVHIITLATPLPPITQPVTIDGYTQPGASPNTLGAGDNAVLQIEIDASVTPAFPGYAAFYITGGGGSTLRGLNVHGNPTNSAALIAIDGAANNVVEGNFVGTNVTGTASASTATNGVVIFNPGSSNNRVGGTAPQQRNVISGNGGGGIGVSLGGTGNQILGNYVGVNAAGTAAVPNAIGMSVQTTGTLTVGGTASGAGNLVSGNTTHGIEAVGCGTVACTIAIQGNLVGTNATGSAAIGNGNIGIWVEQTSGQLSGPVTIGGTAFGAGNVVSGNQFGILTVDGVGVSILGNKIGTDIGGNVAIGNSNVAVILSGASTFNGDVTFGDGTAAGRNIVSGNNGGIQVNLTTASIRGNYVGVASDGVTALPNNGTGISVGSGVAIVGGPAAGEANVIANNNGAGVVVANSFSAIRNASNASIRGNSIVNNAQLGIDLTVVGANGDGVTPNDAGDADAGPNNLQNFPVLNTPVIAAGNVTLSGSLNSTPISDFTIDFYSNVACDPSGNGEGQTYLGSQPVSTDASGNATFSGVTLPIPAGQSFITATATDTNNPASTSEFSACVSPAGGGLPTLSINNVSQNEGNGGTTPFVFTVTLSAASASTVTVNYATADASATAPSDYAATAGTLTFAPGVTTQTITVNVVGDTTVEPNETFSVTLSSPSNATIATGTGTGTILNDDAAATPSLSINNVSQSEGNSGVTPFTFTVTLSAASASTVTVNFATADGSATAPGDYAATSGTLTFAPGVTTQTVTVNVNGDTTVEPSETFVVNLTGAVNATIATGTGVGTILNDDIAAAQQNVIIPTLGEWALVLLALLLGASAALALHRRRPRR
jgi:CSLREA domain-containing protein